MRLWNVLVVATLGMLALALPAAAQNAATGSEPATESAAEGAAKTETGSTAASASPAGASGGASGDTAAGSEPGKTDALPAAAGTASAPVAASAESMPVDGSTYAVRLRDLEARVDELKEQIRRSHTRLSLLSDTILSGGVGGARAEITFKNEMSSAFRLTRALFVLDGAVQYNKQDDTGALAAQSEIPVFSGSIPPGDHTLQVVVQLRGHGYGVFSYLRGYKFDVKTSHSFTITEGKTIELEAVAWEKGGVTTPLEQRPAVRFVERIRSGTASGASGSEQPGSGGIKGNTSVGTGSK